MQALDAAIRRHDPHALDALLMQFAAVIVSTTGAEVDRMEREIMVGGQTQRKQYILQPAALGFRAQGSSQTLDTSKHQVTFNPSLFACLDA
jgi:hypothetical protein